MTEFVVFVFVTIVAMMLLGATTALVVAAFTDPNSDSSGLVNILTDTMNTIIGALIGFIAGKGQGKAEAQEEHEQQRREDEQRKMDQ